MKKALSLFLACLMILSSFTVTSFAAEDEGGSVLDGILSPVNFNAVIVPSAKDQFNDFRFSSPNGNSDYAGTISAGDKFGYTEMTKLIPSGVINNANLFGLSVNEIYNQTSTTIDWNAIQYLSVDDTGSPVVINSNSNFTLVRAYMNRYLKGMFVERFGQQDTLDLFTLENFITITNFIGSFINPNFIKLTKANVDVPYSSEKDFYNSVAVKSGLQDVIEMYWCREAEALGDPSNAFYRNLLDLLGFDHDDEDMLGASKIFKADRVSRTLVRSVIKRIQQQGPVDYLLGVLGKLGKDYHVYTKSIKRLLAYHIGTSISENDLGTFEGFLNLVINGNNPKATDKLQLFDLPMAKIRTTYDGSETDKTNLFMIFLLYFNLVGKWTTGSRVYYGNNGVAETTFVNNPAAADVLIENTDDYGLKCIYKAFLKADFAGFLSLLTDESAKHMEEIKNSGAAAEGLLSGFFAKFFKFFADIFAKIYNSFKNFGDF